MHKVCSFPKAFLFLFSPAIARTYWQQIHTSIVLQKRWEQKTVIETGGLLVLQALILYSQF